MRSLIAILLFCAITVWTGAQPPKNHKKPIIKYTLVFRVPVPEEITSPEDTALPEVTAPNVPGELSAAEISGEIPSDIPGERSSEISGETSAGDISGKTAMEEPSMGRLILGKGKTKAEMLVSFFLNENKSADRIFIEELAFLYISEAEVEGINHDIAFVQMCLETGFLRFGGLVKPEMNNFCGLGALGPGQPGISFPTAQIGIRAHIQHLKAYATELPLKGELVDPRYHLVRRGSVPVVQGLAGTWASDRYYAEKIEIILERLYRYADSHPSYN
ncbi:MAG: glucosaminidase domain-containing protein [Spirochaetaceae bacterium]|jgi:hypothetical protein|nr:glucosaminidase domain-containing protein [Spirochaetaceae bacterium]